MGVGPNNVFGTAMCQSGRGLPRLLPPITWVPFIPVYVEDVAAAIGRVLAGAGVNAGSYEFAGPRVFTYKELVRTVADRINVRPSLVPLPFAVWRILASGAELLPGSPLTRNQVALMQRDNIASGDCPGLSRLDIAPAEIENLASLVMDRS